MKMLQQLAASEAGQAVSNERKTLFQAKTDSAPALASGLLAGLWTNQTKTGSGK